MKKNANFNLKKILIIVAITMLIAIGIIAILINSKRKINQTITSSEIARMQTYDKVKEGDASVNGAVQFDAFFLNDLNGDGYAESIRGTCRELGKEDTLYMEIKVQTEGLLKNAKIEVQGQNFYLKTVLPKDQEIKESALGSNTKQILLNDINNGTQKLMLGTVRSGDYSRTSTTASAIGNNINNYSRNDNKVILTGTYVLNGTEKTIRKEVPFTVDWHGKTHAGIYSTSQSGNIENAINEETNEINFNFTVYTEETNQMLILKDNHVEGEIPLLNGQKPSKVEYTGNQGTFDYNDETRVFTIDKKATVVEEETEKKRTSNKFIIKK